MPTKRLKIKVRLKTKYIFLHLRKQYSDKHIFLDRFHPIRLDRRLLEVYEEIMQHLLKINNTPSLCVEIKEVYKTVVDKQAKQTILNCYVVTKSQN